MADFLTFAYSYSANAPWGVRFVVTFVDAGYSPA
jgi:hypothetical protein